MNFLESVAPALPYCDGEDKQASSNINPRVATAAASFSVLNIVLRAHYLAWNREQGRKKRNGQDVKGRDAQLTPRRSRNSFTATFTGAAV